MLERFSDRARRAIVLATEEARRRGHGAVGPEHLLAGILRDGEGPAAALLAQFGVGLEALRAEAERALDALASPAAGGTVELSGELKRVLEAALALDDRHWRRRVGPEHLVAALLADEDAPAFGIVRAAGADLARARWLLGVVRRMSARASDESVRLIATSRWRVRI